MERKSLDPKRYGLVKTVGTDHARLAWIKSTWRRRGAIPADWDADSAAMLERVGREQIDKTMLRLKAEAAPV